MFISHTQNRMNKDHLYSSFLSISNRLFLRFPSMLLFTTPLSDQQFLLRTHVLYLDYLFISFSFSLFHSNNSNSCSTKSSNLLLMSRYCARNYSKTPIPKNREDQKPCLESEWKDATPESGFQTPSSYFLS